MQLHPCLARIPVLTMLTLFTVGRVSAQEVLIDIGRLAAPPAGWNDFDSSITQNQPSGGLVVNGGLSTTLLDTNGNEFGTFTLSYTGTTGLGFTGAEHTNSGAPEMFDVAGVYNDGFYDNSSGGTVSHWEFSEMSANTTYTMNVWGTREGTGGIFSDGSLTVTSGSTSAGNDLILAKSPDSVYYSELLTFDFTTDSSGTFSFTFDRAPGTSGANPATEISGILIIPEPSSLVLTVLAFGGMILMKRRLK